MTRGRLHTGGRSTSVGAAATSTLIGLTSYHLRERNVMNSRFVGSTAKIPEECPMIFLFLFFFFRLLLFSPLSSSYFSSSFSLLLLFLASLCHIRHPLSASLELVRAHLLHTFAKARAVLLISNPCHLTKTIVAFIVIFLNSHSAVDKFD